MTRRQHLAALAGAGLAGAAAARSAAASSPKEGGAASEPPEVLVAYLRPKEKYWLGWPGTAWDVEGFISKSRALVEGFGKDLGVRTAFEPEPLYDAAAVDKFLAKVEERKPAAILLFPLHMDRWGFVGKLANGTAPTIIFAPLGVCFTGHIAEISRRPKTYLASSTDFELGPVRFGLKMVRTAWDLQRTKVAVVAGGEAKETVLEPLGLKLAYLPRRTFPETLKEIAVTPEVREIAEEYRKAALRIVEPTEEDLLNASRNYFAAKRIMEEHGCRGITMDCLGLVGSREIPCPPCLAWSKLLDAGIPGVCEADTNAVMSHSVCCALLDKPGFMQDPVPHTVANTFIGAHCVSPTRLRGYGEPREPFALRSHAESDLGVAVQVFWKEGQEVTILQFVGPSKMILGKGVVLRNLEAPPAGGCRTSVELAIDGPADTRDTKGFHQLFIYGDHVRDFQAFGQLYGIATEHI
ncbi:MAG: hypothetical protein ACUVYA_09130 [Planctomycetota bacterium]